MTALATVLVDFERLLDGASREALLQPAQDGGWGVVEILPHLRDWDVINRYRVERILSEDRPVLEEPDDSLWEIEHGYSTQDPHKVFAEFRTLREELIEVLGAIDEAAWQRLAVIGERELTLHQLLDEVCERDADHLEQAREALA